MKSKRPDLIEPTGCDQRLAKARRHPASRAPRQIQAQRPIHAMHPFVIPAVTIQPHPVVALPEAPATVLSHEPLEHVDDRRVPHRGVHRWDVPGRSRQSGDAAGAADREPMLCRQDLDDLPTRGRRHSFRLRTPLMAAFSKAKSVHPLQLCVFRFQFLHALQVRDRRAGVLRLPIEVSGPTDAVLPYQLGQRDPRIAVFQDVDDLTFSESGLSHGHSF